MAFGPKHGHVAHHPNLKLVHKLRGKLHDVRSQRIAVRHELVKTIRQAEGVSVDLSQVDSQLSDAVATLENTQARLNSHKKQQKVLAKSLVQTQYSLSLQASAMRKRLRAMYEEGNTPLVSVIFGSASSGDIADRVYLIQRVATADSRKLSDFRKQYNQYQAQKAQQDALVASISREEQNEIAQKESLNQARQAKQTSLDALYQKKQSLQGVLAQMNQDEATIQQEIVDSESIPNPQAPVKFSGKFIWPCHGPITSPFGMRYHPIFHVYRMHTGIDIGVPMGTPIHAAASGIVIVARYLRGYGNTVIINHGGGISTVYAHASKLIVSVGEHVQQGQVVSLAGMTGYATGPHCHFEVRINGKPENPLGFLNH